MRRSILICTIGLVGALLGGQLAVAQQSPGRFVVPRPLLSDPPKVVSRPVPLFQSASAVEPPSAPADTSVDNHSDSDHGQRDHRDHEDRRHRGGGHGGGSHWNHQHGGNGPLFIWPPIILPWPGNVGYIPSYRSYSYPSYSYPGYSNLGLPYYIDPALGNPAWGAWSPLQPPVAQPRAVNPPAPADPLPTADSIKSKIRVTNAAAKARANKFIGYGDANFKKQKYLSAAERYKDAARIAPDVADAFLRQGFAFIAMSNYESAAQAFRRGLAIRSDWNGAPFRLDQFYGDDQITKTSHIESLAKAAEDNPLDGDLLLLLGLMLYFDGQAERSEPFFAAAAQAGGNSDRLLDHFLRSPAQPCAGQRSAQARRKAGVLTGCRLQTIGSRKEESATALAVFQRPTIYSLFKRLRDRRT